ncbi:hypothetical protein GCM10029964_096720 [Kibdelosporangium lantanae]
MTDELPIRDYDQLSAGDLQHRVRSLDEAQLRQVLAHERDHAARAQVELLLTTRLDDLARGARPAGGDQRNAPDVTATPRTPPVSPEHSPMTTRRSATAWPDRHPNAAATDGSVWQAGTRRGPMGPLWTITVVAVGRPLRLNRRNTG